MTDIALVTGANTGIGFEVVRALAQKGMTVYLGSRDTAKGEAAVAELKGEGDIRFVRIDFDATDTFQAALDQIEREQGRLDVLVNNAGASFSGNVFNVTQETILQSYQTNVHGPFYLTQLALPLLRKAAPGARVINVTSGAGQFAFMAGEKYPIPVGQLPYSYCTAKAAMNAATVMLAGALKEEGIIVNACNPGLVNTQVSRFQGKPPAEGAEIIVKLALGEDGGQVGKFFECDGTLLDW